MGYGLAELNAMDLFAKESRRAVDWVAQTFGGEVGSTIERFELYDKKGFESPIEALFFVWWSALQTMRHISFGNYLAPQSEVVACGNRYRLDFEVKPDGMRVIRWEHEGFKAPRVCVELDGHDFHERTREQVIYRNQRDRDLQSDGWLVLHYSGSEIVREPEKVILVCAQKAEDAFWRVDQAIIDRIAENR